MLRVALTAFLLSTLFTVASADGSWQVLAPDGGGFSISLPGNTRHQVSTSETMLGDVVSNVYNVADGPATFSVAYSDIPRTAVLLAGKNTLFAQARDEILKVNRASLLSFDKADWGMLLSYACSDCIGQAQMILVKNRLYVVDVVAPATGASDLAKRVFGSFRLTDPALAQSPGSLQPNKIAERLENPSR